MPSKYLKKEANGNFLQGITTADFASEKMDDTDVDEDKCCLFSHLSGSLMTSRIFWLRWKF